MVRKGMGAKLVGDEVVQRVQSTCIRAPHLIEHMKAPPAWAMFTVNPRRSGNIYAIDGKEVGSFTITFVIMKQTLSLSTAIGPYGPS